MDARIAVVAGVVAATLVGLGAPAVGEEAGPTNDDFATATAIAGTPFGESVDTTVTELELGEPQAPCGSIDKTVWYRFSPSEDQNMIAESTGTFRSVLAVYQGSFFGDFTSVGCTGGTTQSHVEFRALSGQSYFIQLGSARRKGGWVDFHLQPSNWQEKSVQKIDVPVEVQEINAASVTLDAGPRPSDPAMYDVTITASDQQPITRGILTFGLVQEKIHQELARIPKQTTRVVFSIGYRYDAQQYRCLTDSGDGQACTAKSPIKDLNWLTAGEGSRAELIFTIRAEKDGQVLSERSIAVPYAGQVTGMV